MTETTIFDTGPDGEPRYLSDFGWVAVQKEISDHVQAMSADERRNWERGFKRHIADAWCAGQPISKLVI